MGLCVIFKAKADSGETCLRERVGRGAEKAIAAKEEEELRADLLMTLYCGKMDMFKEPNIPFTKGNLYCCTCYTEPTRCVLQICNEYTTIPTQIKQLIRLSISK